MGRWGGEESKGDCGGRGRGDGRREVERWNKRIGKGEEMNVVEAGIRDDDAGRRRRVDSHCFTQLKRSTKLRQ